MKNTAMFDTPLVSIDCTTYNHVNFIRATLEGFVMQQTKFPFEVLIHDDASTDGTADIIRHYERQYPHLILPIYQTENQYSKGVRIRRTFQLPRTRGKYVAWCEGDDYWTDPHKLQKQVDFMEAHPEYSMCFHNVMFVSAEGSCLVSSYVPPGRKQTYHLDDILERCFIQTCSVLVREGLVVEYPGWLSGVLNGDWVLFVLHAMKGDIGYIDEVMAAYRLHSGGVWSPQNSEDKARQVLSLYGLFKGLVGESHLAAIRAGAQATIAACAAAVYEAGEPNDLSSSLTVVKNAINQSTEAGYSDRSFIRATWARSYEALGFVAYRKNDMKLTRRCFTQALMLDPSLAQNKGILSLLFEATFGKKASVLRRKFWLRR